MSDDRQEQDANEEEGGGCTDAGVSITLFFFQRNILPLYLIRRRLFLFNVFFVVFSFTEGRPQIVGPFPLGPCSGLGGSWEGRVNESIPPKSKGTNNKFS